MEKREDYEEEEVLDIEKLIHQLTYSTVAIPHTNGHHSQFLQELKEDYSNDILKIKICMKKCIMENKNISMNTIDIFSYVITDGEKKQTQIQCLYDLSTCSVNHEKIMALTDILLYYRGLFSANTMVDRYLSRFQFLQQSTK